MGDVSRARIPEIGTMAKQITLSISTLQINRRKGLIALAVVLALIEDDRSMSTTKQNSLLRTVVKPGKPERLDGH